MSKRLYPRLAWTSLRKNGKFYLPYILTIMGSAGAFYILMALSQARDLPNMTRYAYLSVFMNLGAIIVGLFSVIFLFYTNSFLMKQRKKELGLYHVLGMGKGHIARVLAWETLYTALLGIIGGVLLGLLFQRGVTALMMRLAKFDMPFDFYISKEGITCTAILFGAILFVNLLCNLKRIHAQNPVELMREGSAGEREPKTRWVLAILGVVTLGAGYSIALQVSNAIEAFAFYFVAVLLVIIGTYCLFTAVSIAVLKLLRKNKNYYYKTRHFIGLSGMLYRMKRNAVGLANICILSTMVLVMVSGTLSLFLGTEEILDDQYPADLTAIVSYDPTQEPIFVPEGMMELLTQSLVQEGSPVASSVGYSTMAFTMQAYNGALTMGEDRGTYTQVTVLTAQDYAQATGLPVPQIQADEVLLYTQGGKLAKGDALANPLNLHFNGAEPVTLTFTVAQRLTEFPKLARAHVGASISNPDQCYLVVADQETMFQIFAGQVAVLGTQEASWPRWFGLFTMADPAGTIDEAAVMERFSQVEEITGTWGSASLASRAANADDLYSVNGGFFFLGIFLGFLFIMATVLIIYYKQITEGYEDRNRFQIMQKVGLEQAEIRRSVNSQVLVVFFAPLLVAAVHVAFDFRLVSLLLNLFGLVNTSMTLLCTVGTLVVFMAVYSIVYALTARVYYKIVS